MTVLQHKRSKILNSFILLDRGERTIRAWEKELLRGEYKKAAYQMK